MCYGVFERGGKVLAGSLDREIVSFPFEHRWWATRPLPACVFQFESNKRISSRRNPHYSPERSSLGGFHDRLHRQDISNQRFEGLGCLGFDAGFSRGDRKPGLTLARKTRIRLRSPNPRFSRHHCPPVTSINPEPLLPLRSLWFPSACAHGQRQ